MAAANSINESVTGIVGMTGTGFTATPATQYNVQVGGATTSTLASIAPSATSGVPLISQGASSNPAYGTAVVAGGGTGAVTLTGVLTGNGTSAVTANAITQYAPVIGGASNAVASTTVGTAGQVLQSSGAGVAAAYSTATYPVTTTVSQILYSSSTNTVAGLATANDGVLITSHTGVPSLLANGTTGQVLTATTGAPPSWAAAGGGGIASATVVVTSAQIKAIRATPITIVAAQGSGKVIIMLYTVAKYTYGGTNAFTNPQPLYLYYNSVSTQNICTEIPPSAVIGSTASSYSTSADTPTTDLTGVAIANMENQPIVLLNPAGSEITGNAANNNTVTIFMQYFVVTL